MSSQSNTVGPDLSAGVPLTNIPEGGLLAGHVGDKNVLIARHNDKLFAIDSKCTHYGGPLHEGIVVGDTVRCPWHHARFSFITGEAVGAPALNPVSCWNIEIDDGTVYLLEHKSTPAPQHEAVNTPESVVIIGGGAAGDAAADMLRRYDHDCPITIISNDSAPPCDRPNLSKDYLAGNAQASWIPLRPKNFYSDHSIDLRLNTEVTAIDTGASEIKLNDGTTLSYGALLLATGAEPIHLDIPGGDSDSVHYLRTQADSEAIINAVEAGAKRAVVIGASFIGLEVAASLIERGLEVHVVAPEACPLERVMGTTLGQFVRSLHESKGVQFHLEQTATAFANDGVTLKNGEQIDADLIVVGIGVRPRTALAEAAGLDVDNGVIVNEHLQTSVPNIYAAGDIARWPDRLSGEPIRVEHWAVAQRQGQAAARNILGADEPYITTPYFWSQHFDAGINYVGHATGWDNIKEDGNPADYDFSARFLDGDRLAALATIYRDAESLEAEADMDADAANASNG